MLKNYFKITWRNLIRNKTFSILNIGGLAIGIVCASLIFLWVEHSFEFNTQLPNSKQIYVVENNQTYGNDIYTMSATCGPLAPAMKLEIPGIKVAARVLNNQSMFSFGDKSLHENGMYADTNFFQIFDFPILQKASNNFLNSSYHIAISKKMAEAFFGKENALGKTLLCDRKDNFVVSAVYDIPSTNMWVQPDWVIPMQYKFLDSNFTKSWSEWGQCGMNSFAMLNENASLENVNNQLRPFIKKKSDNHVDQSVFLYPYTKLGLYGVFKNGKEAPSEGGIKYVKMFSMIAIIILLIACINFMNLSTARSEKRAKEIGLKKVVGMTRWQLGLQFIFESLLMSFLAVLLALLILAICTPAFGNLVNISLQLNLTEPSHLIFLLLIGLLCGLVAGSYPAFYLSSFNPIRALKKQTAKTAGGANLLRKGLVVLQFTVSVIMIICTIVVFKQINHTKNRDLGFDKDNIMMLASSENLMNGYTALKQNLIGSGNVKDVALSWGSMFQMYSNGGGFKWKGYDPKQEALITVNGISPNYLSMMNVKLSSGRYFYDDFQSDSNNIIINAALAKLMGKEGKVGGRIYRNDDGSDVSTIVGITSDFVYNDIYGKPQPLIFYPVGPKSFASWGSIFVKLKPTQDQPKQIASIQAVLKKIDNQYPFDYYFLDDSFNRLFSQSMFIGKLALLFGGLAIFISCLGLFGLSAFMAEQRTKEVGVRKVLGASVFSITQLLNKDFLRLVIIAFVIAAPIAWWVMNNWLQNYAYRIDIQWWIFLLAAIITIAIALITVSFQSIKAAVANPVKSLKVE